ncbi:hypothetical protein ABZ357_31285 [Streptomyces sp. NPDC005917]|uniref:hypothetical protein n=1 Tax=unclassified Streptomyces TaxID=2593676 RepID=UPI0033FFF33F
MPGKRYGCVTPKVEFQRFHIDKAYYGAHCTVVVDKEYGVCHAVTAKLFYSTCMAKHQGSPKP